MFKKETLKWFYFDLFVAYYELFLLLFIYRLRKGAPYFRNCTKQCWSFQVCFIIKKFKNLGLIRNVKVCWMMELSFKCAYSLNVFKEIHNYFKRMRINNYNHNKNIWITQNIDRCGMLSWSTNLDGFRNRNRLNLAEGLVVQRAKSSYTIKMLFFTFYK